MERRARFVWWAVLIVLIGVAVWKLFLPHGSKAYLQKSSSSREIVVYVAGAVEKQGLIRLPLESRLDDALKLAKPLAEANLDILNPAERLKDGQKITISYKPNSNIGAQASTQSNSNVASNPPISVSSSASGSALTSNNSSNFNPIANPNQFGSPNSGTDLKVNINTAGAGELDRLPNIGPALAERILQYRNEHGPFQRAEDLKNVSGIGEKTYEKMAPMITIGP